MAGTQRTAAFPFPRRTVPDTTGDGFWKDKMRKGRGEVSRKMKTFTSFPFTFTFLMILLAEEGDIPTFIFIIAPD